MQKQLKHKFKKNIFGLILLTNQTGSNISQISITFSSLTVLLFFGGSRHQIWLSLGLDNSRLKIRVCLCWVGGWSLILGDCLWNSCATETSNNGGISDRLVSACKYLELEKITRGRWRHKHIQSDIALQLHNYYEPAVVVLLWYLVKDKKT